MNLVVNARQAMPEGGSITIATSRCMTDTLPCAVLKVRDSGPGMDEATRQRALEPFFTTKLERGGTGMGLAIVNGIVKQFGGSVRIDTAPGRGCTFEIHCPAEPGGIGGAGEARCIESHQG